MYKNNSLLFSIDGLDLFSLDGSDDIACAKSDTVGKSMTGMIR